MNTPSPNAAVWRRRTGLLMALILGLWLVAAFGPLLMRDELDKTTVLGFPLGTFTAIIGVPIVFAILIFAFAGRQDALDRTHGFAEED